MQEREFFALCELSHGVLEIDLDHDVGDGFVSGVGDGAVDVADGGSDEIFGGGHFEVGEFQFRNVGRRGHDWLGRLAEEQRSAKSDSDDDNDRNDNDHAARVAFWGSRGGLAEGVHEGDCRLLDFRCRLGGIVSGKFVRKAFTTGDTEVHRGKIFTTKDAKVHEGIWRYRCK